MRFAITIVFLLILSFAKGQARIYFSVLEYAANKYTQIEDYDSMYFEDAKLVFSFANKEQLSWKVDEIWGLELENWSCIHRIVAYQKDQYALVKLAMTGNYFFWIGKDYRFESNEGKVFLGYFDKPKKALLYLSKGLETKLVPYKKKEFEALTNEDFLSVKEVIQQLFKLNKTEYQLCHSNSN